MKFLSSKALLGLAGGLVLVGMGCEEVRELETEPPGRSRPFERTDRLFEDEDKAELCFNPNGVNNSFFDANGKVDLTRTPRQGFVGQPTRPGDFDSRKLDEDDIIGFPDAQNGPLFGHDECSVGTKNWAGGYYKAAGLPPTMGQWCEDYGLASDCQSANMNLIKDGGVFKDLQISYFNAHALPVFRVTLCNSEEQEFADGVPVIDPETGAGFACVNLNYACPQRIRPGLRADSAEGDDFDDVQCNPFDPDSDDFDDPNCAPCEAVSVVMHYDVPPGGDKPIVVFGAYRGVGGNAPLMDRIDLNFSGVEETFETIPNVCQSCHGGDPYEPTDIKNPTADDVDIQAQFLPINFRFALRDAAELFAFLDGNLDFEDSLMAGEPLQPDNVLERLIESTDDEGNMDFSLLRLQFRDLNGSPVANPIRPDISDDLSDTLDINSLIQKISPLEANRFTLDVLNDAFEDAIDDGDVDEVELHADSEIPDGWTGDAKRENFYRLVAEHCNDGCHLALPPPLDFQSYDDFIQYRETIARDMCNDFSMPHSPESFNLFWSKSERVGDNTRLNKNNNIDLIETGDDDARGDVELFLTYDDIGWEPIAENVEQCNGGDVPGLAITFLNNIEFVSNLTIEKKAEDCVKEHTGEIPVGFYSCRNLCEPRAVLDDRFDKAARVNLKACEEIAEELDCQSVDLDDDDEADAVVLITGPLGPIDPNGDIDLRGKTDSAEDIFDELGPVGGLLIGKCGGTVNRKKP